MGTPYWPEWLPVGRFFWAMLTVNPTKCCANGNFHMSSQRPASGQHTVLMTSASTSLDSFSGSGCLRSKRCPPASLTIPGYVCFCQPAKVLQRRGLMLLPNCACLSYDPIIWYRSQMLAKSPYAGLCVWVRRRQSSRFVTSHIKHSCTVWVPKPGSGSVVVENLVCGMKD